MFLIEGVLLNNPQAYRMSLEEIDPLLWEKSVNTDYQQETNFAANVKSLLS